MKKTLIGKGYASEEYRVEGITNESDIELINFCDSNNFGGRVRRHMDTAIVIVYID